MDIKARYEAAKTQRQTELNEISLAFKYVAPDRDPMGSSESITSRSHLFDNTATAAVGSLTSSVMQYLLPTDERWAEIALSEDFRRMGVGTTTAQAEIDHANKLFYEAVNGSAFYLAAFEAVDECVIAGVGAISIAMDPDGLVFASVPVRELYHLDDGTGINAVFRCHRLAASVIVSRYKNVPAEIKEIARTRPDELLEVVETQTAGKKPGTYEYGVYLGRDFTQLEKRTVKYPSFIVFRWERRPNGRSDSPVRKALSEIMATNQIRADMISHAEFASRPTYLTTDNVLKDRGIVPGSMNPVDDINALAPLKLSGDFNVGVETLQDHRRQIRDIIAADMLPDADPSDRRTRDEINIRYQQWFRKMRGTALRLEAEFIEPVTRAIIRCLQSVGKMPAFEIDDNPVCLTTRSIVKQVEASRKIESTMTVFATAAQLGPEGIQHVDRQKFGRWIFETAGFPAALLRDPEEVEKELDAIAAAQAAGGAQAIQTGQGNQETTAATGQAVARLAGRL